jgi:hypothetical protein
MASYIADIVQTSGGRLHMMRSKYRWLIGGTVLALVLLGAYGYFIGTRALLEQAESFAFRRMTVPQLSDQGTFQFFFVTNRREADLAASVDERFHSERQQELSFGFHVLSQALVRRLKIWQSQGELDEQNDPNNF